MNGKLDDLMRSVVDRLIEAVETAGDWNKPWRALATGQHRNVETDRVYQGINALILWIEELRRGLGDPRWGTYRTWQRVGAQVRTGESGTRLIFWKPLYRCDSCDETFGDDKDAALEHQARRHGGEYGHVTSAPILQWFTVFNAGQVDDAPPFELEEVPNVAIQLEEAERFVDATGVEIVNHPSRAFFNHARPEAINVPEVGQFDTEARYWGTVFHELTHWTGHESRLSRQGRNAFGDANYAGEELVAELGSAFLSAQLRVETEPHPEHAAYLAHWLDAIKAEPTRLYTAAKAASEAVRYLTDLADDEEVAA